MATKRLEARLDATCDVDDIVTASVVACDDMLDALKDARQLLIGVAKCSGNQDLCDKLIDVHPSMAIEIAKALIRNTRAPVKQVSTPGSSVRTFTCPSCHRRFAMNLPIERIEYLCPWARCGFGLLGNSWYGYETTWVCRQLVPNLLAGSLPNDRMDQSC
jgi:hypothetical protein